MDIFWITMGVIITLIVLFIIYKIFRANTFVVPEGSRVVIYRMGRFDRVAGPGMIQIMRGVEQVERTIEVRDHPLEVTAPGIFAFGVPNDLTLSLWCRFDPVAAAGRDKTRLATLVQLNESERRRQIEIKMREALINQVVDLQKRWPLPPNPTPIEGIVALAPGGERYQALLAGLKKELEMSLPSVGVILDTSQSVTVTNRGLPDNIIAALKRSQGREIDSQWLRKYADDLRQQFPETSSAVLDQVLSSIEGIEAGNLQRFRLEQEGGGGETDIEMELPISSSSPPNLIAKPRMKLGDTKHPGPAGPHEIKAVMPAFAGLTKNDLAILKRVPRSQRQPNPNP
jgi:regulator of protease activity HflC (stomatin/prohibitin superfamily)